MGENFFKKNSNIALEVSLVNFTLCSSLWRTTKKSWRLSMSVLKIKWKERSWMVAQNDWRYCWHLKSTSCYFVKMLMPKPQLSKQELFLHIISFYPQVRRPRDTCCPLVTRSRSLMNRTEWWRWSGIHCPQSTYSSLTTTAGSAYSTRIVCPRSPASRCRVLRPQCTLCRGYPALLACLPPVVRLHVCCEFRSEQFLLFLPFPNMNSKLNMMGTRVEKMSLSFLLSSSVDYS